MKLCMRTYHNGGMDQGADNSFVESNFAGNVKIRNRSAARDSQGRLVAMGRNMAVVITDDEGRERAVHKITQGAHLRVDEGDVIKRGQRLAGWGPFSRSIIAETDGVVEFKELLGGMSV